MKISVVCDNKECAALLENAGKELNIEVVCEVQNGPEDISGALQDQNYLTVIRTCLPSLPHSLTSLQ